MRTGLHDDVAGEAVKLVEFRPELPTTAVGKALRRELREPWQT